MTDDDTAIDLREGLAHVPDRAAPAPGAPTPDELWAAAHGELPPREALRVVDQALADPVAWEEWRLLQAFEEELLAQGDEPAANDGPDDEQGRPRWGWITVGVGLAAALVAVISMPREAELRPAEVDDAATFRAAPQSGPSSLLAPDQALPRDAFELRWEPGPEGARYELQVSTAEPRLLVHERGLTEARFVVPAAALDGVPAGGAVLWRVEQLHDDARRRSATFVTTIE
ncbi:MAG: hypothetical protein KDK70_13885 [Myxococcales bacterium]|nr:hypothetical protein [Myxococcales bacterium]